MFKVISAFFQSLISSVSLKKRDDDGYDVDDIGDDYDDDVDNDNDNHNVEDY